jgi:elongation factor Tu
MSATWFVDRVDDGHPIEVIADVRFLSVDEGGRTRPVRTGYRPNHNFGPADGRDFYIGQIEIAAGDEITPDESRRVSIRFISGPGLSELLVPGREWRIQEALKLVALARVVEVVAPPDHGAG